MNKQEDTPYKILSTRIFASATTATIMYPGDLARALKMATAAESNQSALSLLVGFSKQHGVKGLLKQGLVPEITRATVMRSFKFIAVPLAHEKFFGKPLSEGTSRTTMISASVASMVEACLISPAEVAKIALQFDHTNKYKNSMSRAISDIVKTRGVWSMWTALPTLIYRQSIWSAVFFQSLNQYRALIAPLFQPYIDQHASVGVMQNLTVGFASGVTATVANTPGDVVRTNITKGTLESAPVQSRLTYPFFKSSIQATVDTTKTIVRQQGFMALYRGFGPKAFHLGVSGGLMVMFIELFTKLYDQAEASVSMRG